MRGKKRIPIKAGQLPEGDHKYLNKIEQETLGISNTDKDNSPYVALKYYESKYQCFSEWNQDELKAFSSFVEKLKGVTWEMIWGSGGKYGKKEAFGLTIHKDRKKLPNNGNALNKISPDIDAFELRVTNKARVHGFRSKSAFFLIWLDRNHKIYPQ